MNGYERCMAVCRGEKADILPRVPILMAFAAEYIGSNYGAFASDHRVLVEANLRCAKDFDFDQVSAISDPYRETQGFGAQIRFVRDGVPRCVKPPLEDARDLAPLAAPNPRRSTRMADRMSAVDAFKAQVGGTYSILGWIEGPAAEAADLRGVTNFLMDLIDDVEFSKRLMDRCTEVAIAFGVAQVRAGADTVGMGDAIVSQVSPALYEELVLPRERRIVEAIHEAGGLVRLHICGNITPHLPAIARLGADVVDLDWMVDMKEAREALGAKTVLTGNLDPVAAVKGSAPRAIEAAIREIHRDVGDPYMAGAGCEIPPGTPHENLRALCARIPCGDTGKNLTTESR
jgi:MtaA/CmuA family methyltransferase